MKFSSVLLACLPAASAASVAYKAPAALVARAEKNPESCVIPKIFLIKNFVVQPAVNGTNDTSPVAGFKFTYVNPATNLTTSCHYHHRAQGLNETASHERFPCNNKDVSFIWASEKSKMTAVQNICPDSNGKAEYAALGNLRVPISCIPGSCKARGYNFKGLFSEIKPIQHQAHSKVVRKKHTRGLSWFFDGFN
ncbi:hypothetical protein E4U42_004883 [Claviceps africana]|uniref:AA1-like domain-containing protein n=1 Tax=Claviceps africana TaxID=83212 RepID=A0A8K0JHT0_9HYPO|nr:hypothetical protein E4U42_004883 [Claviceps africana]